MSGSQFPNEADRQASRELWVQTVRGAIDAGRSVTTVPAKTAKDRHKAKEQSFALSRKTYGWSHPNYDLIKWH